MPDSMTQKTRESKTAHVHTVKTKEPADARAGTAAHAAAANGLHSRADEGPEEIKHFVLDTNVLLHNPNALFVFQEHEVVIPFAVIEELDKLKRTNDDIGRNARECIRHLDRLRS